VCDKYEKLIAMSSYGTTVAPVSVTAAVPFQMVGSNTRRMALLICAAVLGGNNLAVCVGQISAPVQIASLTNGQTTLVLTRRDFGSLIEQPIIFIMSTTLPNFLGAVTELTAPICPADYLAQP
jgi:hypothetical protein